jgi:transposase
MPTYIGLDVHDASTTLAAVDDRGKHLGCPLVLETRAKAIIEAVKTLPRPRYLCLEEGTQSAWLYETVSPHVDNMVVEAKTERRNKGPKDDARDAYDQANKLRTGTIDKNVYKNVGSFGRLRMIARVYGHQVQDSTRVQNRIKALYRSRGIKTKGKQIYQAPDREDWIKKLPTDVRPCAQLLGREYDAIEELRKNCHDEMLAEARKHPIVALIATVPGLGPIRSAQLVPIIVTPERFRTKHQLWKYAGFGIIMRSSSDWRQDKQQGKWKRDMVAHTRGLNRDYNRTLKAIFKGAAGTVIQRADPSCPLYQHYKSLTGAKTKPNLAKLTIARQIAAITLAIWKEKSRYDAAKVKTNT